MKILFIAEAKSFMVDAITKNLTAAKFEVIFAKSKINDIEPLQKDALIILMYLSDNVDDMTDTLVYLKDITVEGEKKLFIVGSESEVKTVKQIIPEAVITGVMPRPLNVKELVDRMNDAVSDLNKREEKKHILIVDDDPVMLRTIKEWLSAKYNVTMVNSGMNAITYLAKNRPDLVLLDYEMPVCSGPQTLEMMRSESDTSDIPVMFLTAKGDRESVMKVLSLKPEGYLLKTMKPAEIIDSLETFFEKQKAAEVSRL